MRHTFMMGFLFVHSLTTDIYYFVLYIYVSFIKKKTTRKIVWLRIRVFPFPIRRITDPNGSKHGSK